MSVVAEKEEQNQEKSAPLKTRGRVAQISPRHFSLGHPPLEARVILHKLQKHRWNMTQTGSALGLERSDLYRKMKALGIAAAEYIPRGMGTEKQTSTSLR